VSGGQPEILEQKRLCIWKHAAVDFHQVRKAHDRLAPMECDVFISTSSLQLFRGNHASKGAKKTHVELL
jgi:hypothetical protein